MDPQKEFGINVRNLRRKKGWTQEELSYETGVDRGDVSRIESGEANPTLETISYFVAALETTYKEIFDFDENDNEVDDQEEE